MLTFPLSLATDFPRENELIGLQFNTVRKMTHADIKMQTDSLFLIT